MLSTFLLTGTRFLLKLHVASFRRLLKSYVRNNQDDEGVMIGVLREAYARYQSAYDHIWSSVFTRYAIAKRMQVLTAW